MSSYRATIGNFTFTFIFGRDPVNGIMFDPEAEYIGTPEWQRAASVACAIWPYQKARADMDMYASLGYTLKREFEYNPALLKRLWELKSVVDEGIDRGYLPLDAVDEDLIEAMHGRFKEPSYPKPSPTPKKRRGYVYVLSSDSGLYKIGRAADPKDRRRTFGVKMPFLVAYEIVIKTNDYIALEEALHERFSEQRIRGEWFALATEDIQALKDEYENVADQFND